MNRRYRDAWFGVWGMLTAIGQLVEEDFPNPEVSDTPPTRYELDALNGLAGELGRLVEGYERK